MTAGEPLRPGRRHGGGRLTDEVRRADGGQCLALDDGVTYCRIEGPTDGAPIVLLHGATVPLWEFDALVPHLHSRGFRTLRFDLYGHGLSDRPAVDYSLDLFVRQTLAVVAAAGFKGPAALLGHSLGAAIAAAAAARAPAAFARLLLVTPMLDFDATNPFAPLLRAPVVGELVMHLLGAPMLKRRRRRRYARIGRSDLTPRFLEQAAYDGFFRALLSMTRQATLGDQAPRYAALRSLRPELLVLAGAADRVIPAADIARIRNLLPCHMFIEIGGAEHNLLLTHAAEAAAAISAFAAPARHRERED